MSGEGVLLVRSDPCVTKEVTRRTINFTYQVPPKSVHKGREIFLFSTHEHGPLKKALNDVCNNVIEDKLLSVIS
jgi:hypothetical protein